MNRDEQRTAARDIFQHTLHAVNARAAVRNVVTIDGSTLHVATDEFSVGERPIYLIGAGKAALSMALGLNDVVGKQIARAVISSTSSGDSESLPSNHTMFFGGHPLPNNESLRAAEAAFELLTEANQKKAFVVFLISGGGSAMIEWPISKDITLEDLQEANRQLITCGATIDEINAVRRSFSAIKGGKLAALTNPDSIVTLIISDTNRGNDDAVASGPTLSPSHTAPEAEQVVEKYSLTSTLPASVFAALRRHPSTQVTNSPFHVLLDNQSAMEAAAERAAALGFSAAIACDINEQPIDEGSNLFLTRAASLRNKPNCLISGGEFSCRVRGNGRGGRNLETVLRCAIKIDQDQRSNNTVVLSAGTDGIDGSSFAAGAIADESTITRAKELGLDPVEFLEQSDSHAFFEALDDLIITGPTGTNVRDLRIVLCG